MKTIFTFIFLAFPFLQAAPFPATSTSSFLKTDQGFFYGTEGFSLSAQKLNWKPQLTSKPGELTSVVFQSENDSGSLSAQIYQEKKPSFEKDVKDWIKDYPFYGFKILNSKTISENKQKGIVIDLVHKKKQKQVRQIILETPTEQSLVFTCQDSVSNFAQTLDKCNQVLRSLSWLAK